MRGADPRSRKRHGNFSGFRASDRHSESDPIAALRLKCQSSHMWTRIFAFALLAGCAEELSSDVCGETFCIAAEADLIGKQQIADFNLYQVRFAGERFGIYEGDFPDFDAAGATPVSIPVDSNARLILQNGESQVLAMMSETSPRYLHVTGPCPSSGPCPLLDMARSLTRN